MNPALRGIEAESGPPAIAGPNTFRRDLHPDPALRDADYVLANGPASAGSSNQSGEGEIRQKLIEADLVDCMVALPGQLFGKFGMN